MFRVPRFAFRVFLLLLLAPRAESQVDPSGPWRTLHTPHFRIHFRPAYRAVALLEAREAERSYALLAGELHPPRGVVDLTLGDDIDAANGFTTVFPTSRITIFATPPAGDHGLLFYDSWLRLVTTHELTHVFHLDRTKGIWSALQHVFGRAPGLFPNEYQPSWAIEGLATYYESRFTNGGRVRSSFHTQVLAADRAADASRSPWDALLFSRWADGIVPYAYGSRFLHSLASVAGDSVVPRFVEATSGQLIPFRVGRQVARVAPGHTLATEWIRGTRPPPGSDGRQPPVQVPKQVIDSLLRTEPVPRVSPDGRRGAPGWWHPRGVAGGSWPSRSAPAARRRRCPCLPAPPAPCGRTWRSRPTAGGGPGVAAPGAAGPWSAGRSTRLPRAPCSWKRAAALRTPCGRRAGSCGSWPTRPGSPRCTGGATPGGRSRSPRSRWGPARRRRSPTAPWCTSRSGRTAGSCDTRLRSRAARPRPSPFPSRCRSMPRPRCRCAKRATRRGRHCARISGFRCTPTRDRRGGSPAPSRRERMRWVASCTAPTCTSQGDRSGPRAISRWSPPRWATRPSTSRRGARGPTCCRHRAPPVSRSPSWTSTRRSVPRLSGGAGAVWRARAWPRSSSAPATPRCPTRRSPRCARHAPRAISSAARSPSRCRTWCAGRCRCRPSGASRRP